MASRRPFQPPDVASVLASLHDVVAANSEPLPPHPTPRVPQISPGGALRYGAAGGGGGAPGDVKSQMKAGFMRAGRPDLAAMVDTPEFHRWIQQESSWRDLTSAANNQGKPNYGYFQLWAGHPWARPGLPADEQAYLAATKFKLTPDRIRGFAAQIARGTYKGWG